MSQARPSNGFVLLELLAVIVIVGVLGLIVIASVGNLGPSAAASSYQSDVNTVETALEAYKAETGHYPDPGPKGQAELTGPGGFLQAWPSSSLYDIALDPVVPGQLDVTPPGGLRLALAAPGRTPRPAAARATSSQPSRRSP